jgi:hypothetical protein
MKRGLFEALDFGRLSKGPSETEGLGIGSRGGAYKNEVFNFRRSGSECVTPKCLSPGDGRRGKGKEKEKMRRGDFS